MTILLVLVAVSPALAYDPTLLNACKDAPSCKKAMAYYNAQSEKTRGNHVERCWNLLATYRSLAVYGMYEQRPVLYKAASTGLYTLVDTCPEPISTGALRSEQGLAQYMAQKDIEKTQ